MALWLLKQRGGNLAVVTPSGLGEVSVSHHLHVFSLSLLGMNSPFSRCNHSLEDTWTPLLLSFHLGKTTTLVKSSLHLSVPVAVWMFQVKKTLLCYFPFKSMTGVCKWAQSHDHSHLFWFPRYLFHIFSLKILAPPPASSKAFSFFSTSLRNWSKQKWSLPSGTWIISLPASICVCVLRLPLSPRGHFLHLCTVGPFPCLPRAN